MSFFFGPSISARVQELVSSYVLAGVAKGHMYSEGRKDFLGRKFVTSFSPPCKFVSEDTKEL